MARPRRHADQPRARDLEKTKPLDATGAPRATRAAAILQLKALAAALGDDLFRQLSTLEHQVAACILAGDNYAEAARYVGVSPSVARRSVLRILARLSDRAPVLRVLVADDHPAHRLLLAAVFESLGCSVHAVEDGAQAVALAAGFDVICLDRNMPGMTGDEAARRIGRRAFLIACTSEPAGVSADFDAVIGKPILYGAMAEAIQAARQTIVQRRAARAAATACR